MGIKFNHIIAKRRLLPSKKKCRLVNRPSGGFKKQFAARSSFTGSGYNIRRFRLVYARSTNYHSP